MQLHNVIKAPHCAEEHPDGKTGSVLRLLRSRMIKLKDANIDQMWVFDGLDQPAKAATQQERKQKMKDEKERVEKLRQQPGQVVPQAFGGANHVTEDFQTEVIELCQEQNVPFVVAPFQADAELVSLQLRGKITYIMSRDTDMLVHGGSALIVEWDWSQDSAALICDSFPCLASIRRCLPCTT